MNFQKWRLEQEKRRKVFVMGRDKYEFHVFEKYR